MNSSLIKAPEGLFEPCYNTALTPEDIRIELDGMKEDGGAPAELRQKLYDYRFFTQKDGRSTIICDRFVVFWVELLFSEKTTGTSKWALNSVKKRLVKMLNDKKLTDIFGETWPDDRVLYEQLYNSARRYLFSSQHDSTYSSYAFGIMRMGHSQVINRLLGEFIDTSICFTYRCGLLADYPVIGKAALHAWNDELPKMDDRVWERIEKKAGAQGSADILRILT